jgi:NifU-like protein involved in Fe-S cluster formation
MLNEVYNARILGLAGNIPRLGRLSSPDASATAHSKLCGSTVTVDLKVSNGAVSDFAHDVKACALGQASSSIMARNVIGAKPAELRELRETVRKMLKENGPPPSGKWAEIAVLEPVRNYKARHASTMLTFDAVVSALDQIEAKSADKRPQAAEWLFRRGQPAGLGSRKFGPVAERLAADCRQTRQIPRSSGVTEADPGSELRALCLDHH